MSSESPTNKTKSMPVFYHRLHCSSSPILQALIELGIKDDKVTVKTITAEEQKEASFLALNASGQLPVYVDGQGNAMAESIAVMQRVLDDFDSENKLMPAVGDHRRYVCIEAMCLAGTALFPTLANFDSSKDEIKKEAHVLANTKLTVAVEAMLKRFDGPYVLGDQLSAADFFLGFSLLGMKMSTDEPAMISSTLIASYVATMEKLPSTREVYELDAAEKPSAEEEKKVYTTETKMEETEDKKEEEEDATKNMEVEATADDAKAKAAEIDSNPAEEEADKVNKSTKKAEPISTPAVIAENTATTA